MKILLQNTQPLLGDRLMFTPLIRDLKKAHPDWQIGVLSAGPEIWENNPHIDPSVTLHNCDKHYNVGPRKVTHGSKTNGLHITSAFRCSLEEQLDEKIPQGPFRPDIYLSESEKNHRIIDGKYWVINIDTGPFSSKRWPADRFQDVVDECSDLTFVQVGLSKDNQYRLQGDNVIDLLDQTKIRELFSLVYRAEGCISLVSSLMHIAAAFDKPCVVIAGGREPPTFERYAHHRYLDNVGCLPCCRLQACWHNALSACEDHDGHYAHCMRLIEASDVVSAVRSYYRGGRLLSDANCPATAIKRPLLRLVAKCSMLGGAERSVIQIARLFVERGWRVELSPAGPVHPSIQRLLPPAVAITNHLSRPCDVFLLYASDLVYQFHDEKFDVFERLAARRKIMALTYKIGKAGDVPWTKGWDRYLFLSSALRDGFIRKSQTPQEKMKVLAPAVDLTPFLNIEPKYDQPLTLVRHSSQGDKKFPPDLTEIIAQCKARFFFMPGPSWLKSSPQITTFPHSDNPADVAKFLVKGNCFWYLLPENYTDQGPRVIVEAMAAGLPVIAEDRDGAADRVTTQTGWKVQSHQEAINLIQDLIFRAEKWPETLAQKGQAARQRAKEDFVVEKWFDAITQA